jgi:molecular chaperone HscB
MSPFETLGLATVFRLDKSMLDRVYREKSRMGQSYEVSEAYQILKDPVKRAEAVFSSFGTAIGDEHEPKPTHDFLLEILEAREQLSEQRLAGDTVGIEALAATTAATFERMLATLDDELTRRRSAKESGKESVTGPEDLKALLPQLGELRYLAKLLLEAKESLDT